MLSTVGASSVGHVSTPSDLPLEPFWAVTAMSRRCGLVQTSRWCGMPGMAPTMSGRER